MASIGNVTFACEDPAGLASFWADALAYELEEPPPGVLEAIEAAGGDTNAAAAARDPTDEGPRLFFKKLPVTNPDQLPIHLDLEVSDRAAAVERLTGLGATVVEEKSQTTGPLEETWTVMRDPEGNGFCVQSGE